MSATLAINSSKISREAAVERESSIGASAPKSHNSRAGEKWSRTEAGIAAEIPAACRTFVILGPPRTKKTSNRIVKFGKAKQFTRILPSKEHELWHRLAMQQTPSIRAQLIRAGLHLPISEPVRIKALFYREMRTGDLCGYLQALGDFLQESRQRKGKTVRTGAGIIRDDSQVESWDGSRRMLDKLRPRIEVTIQILPGSQIEMPLEEQW